MTSRLLIRKIDLESLCFDWKDSFWENLDAISLNFHREENKQNPSVEVKVFYNELSLILFWKVEEMNITCNHKNHFDNVYEDSCVEFFIKPFGAVGYFNFEISCIGKVLSYYITDWMRDSDGTLKEFTRLSIDDIEKIKIIKTFDESDEGSSEINKWFLLVEIPFQILIDNSELNKLDFEKKWHGNFYKCADSSPLPHWSSWNKIEELNFHQPKDFGEIVFEIKL